MILKSVAELVNDVAPVMVNPEISVREAAQKMVENDVNALAVMQGGLIVGLVCEKDIVRKCVAQAISSDETCVDAIMTTDLKMIEASDSVAHAIDLMSEGGFHHLPVLKGNMLIGILNNDDIPEEYRLLLEHYRELKG